MIRSEALNRKYRLGAYSATAPRAQGDGFDWADAGMGVGAAFGLMLLAGAGAMAVRRRRPPIHLHP